MAIIFPSYREKRRYILVFNFNKTVFFTNFIRLFGLYTLAKAGIIIIFEDKNYAVIRSSKKYLHYTLTALYFSKAKLGGIFKKIKEVREFLKQKNLNF